MTRIMLGVLISMQANATHTQNTTPATPPPCSAEEYRQLDFWVGDWTLSYDQGPGKPKGTAHNVITKGDFGTCVITEHFTMKGLNGTSVSTFHKPVGQWRQTWVDDQGGYFDLVGGPAPKDADYDFGLELVHPEGLKAPYLRMIWQIKDKDHLVWRWQGRKTADTQWQDRWVLDYTRVGSK